MATTSSLILLTKWEYSQNSNSNKESRNSQCYRNVKPNTTQDAMSIVTNRHKIMGRGRSLQLKFTSESGADAELIGYGIQFNKNTKP